MDKSVRIVLILLFAVCIFDPADKLLGLKIPLFVMGWLLFIFAIISRGKTVYLSIGAITYLLLFIFIIPLTSVSYYLVTNGDLVNYDGYLYFKAYLFLSVVLILHILKIDMIKPTIALLTLMSILTLIIFFIVMFYSSFPAYFYETFGNRFGILDVGFRDYGRFLFPLIHFYAAPLILFAIGYFTFSVLNSRGKKRIGYGLLLALNMSASFLGGTRNNMLISIMTPMLILYWYCKEKIYILCFGLAFAVLTVASNLDLFRAFLDPEYTSNMIKLSLFEDYVKLFGEPRILLFGQGLGSSFETTVRGIVSVTELTYFEFVRRFGLILSILSFGLLLYPLSKLRLDRYRRVHYLFLSYLLYLLGCFVQPLLMSSTGMLLLSIVLFHTFVCPSFLNEGRVQLDNKIKGKFAKAEGLDLC
jgi:hypothetical protein